MKETYWSRFVAGAIQLAATLALTGLILYLALVIRIDTRWLRMLIMTSAIFAFTGYHTRDKWNNWRYWLVLSVCLIVHIGVLLLVQVGRGPMPVLFYGILAPVEIAGIVMIILKSCD